MMWSPWLGAQKGAKREQQARRFFFFFLALHFSGRANFSFVLLPVSVEYPGSRDLSICPLHAVASPQYPAALGTFGHPVPSTHFPQGLLGRMLLGHLYLTAIKVQVPFFPRVPPSLVFFLNSCWDQRGGARCIKFSGREALHARKQCFVFTFDFDQLRNLCSENLVLLCLLGYISSLLTAFLSALGLSSCSQFLLFLMPWSMLPCGRVHFLPLPTHGERATTNTPFGGLFFIPTSLTYVVSKHWFSGTVGSP